MIMDKLELLRNKIASYRKLCIAFSGGVDSSFLLHVAHDVLRKNVFAVLIDSSVLARRDETEAIDMLKKLGVDYKVISGNPFEVSAFCENNKLRCYYCKKNNYEQIIRVAKEHQIDIVADGQNADDALADDRPGSRAAKELGVISPLSDCGLTKEEIRRYSKELDVVTWDKPSNACLATRLPFGTMITPKKLAIIEAAEEVLRKRGIEGCRVRWHDNIARIEAPRNYFDIITSNPEIADEIKALGFKYITLDLEGFRSGSMN